MFIKFVSSDKENNNYNWYTNIVECKEAMVTLEHSEQNGKVANVLLDNNCTYQFPRETTSIYLMNNMGKTIDSWPSIVAGE